MVHTGLLIRSSKVRTSPLSKWPYCALSTAATSLFVARTGIVVLISLSFFVMSAFWPTMSLIVFLQLFFVFFDFFGKFFGVVVEHLELVDHFPVQILAERRH